MPDLICTNDRYCPTRDVFASVDEFQTMARLAFGSPVTLHKHGRRWLDDQGETVLTELDPAEPPSKVALTSDEIEAALRRRIQMRELAAELDDHGFEEPPGRVVGDEGVIGYYEQTARDALAELARSGQIDPPCEADVSALAAALKT